MLNIALDTTGIWRIGTTTNFEYNNYVNYLTIDKQSDSQKNTTRTSNYSEDIVVAYNRGWMEVEFNGSIAYSHTRNLLQNSANQNIWILAYGTNITLEFPWGMSLYTAIHQNSHRGYSDNAMNNKELIWNMQLNQSFLKRKALTLSIQWFDILAQQRSLSRRINANRRTDTRYNSINSYGMLHIIYKINMFGGRSSRNDIRNGNETKRTNSTVKGKSRNI